MLVLQEKRRLGTEVVGALNWRDRRISLELFLARQIRMARKRFAKHVGEDIEHLPTVAHFWTFLRMTLGETRAGRTAALVRGTLKHVNPEWREQRWVGAQVFDPKKKMMMSYEDGTAECSHCIPFSSTVGLQLFL